MKNNYFYIRFENIGGKILKQTVTSFEDVSGYDIVVNCTGFGAKVLCKDHDLVPIRGQVFKVNPIHFSTRSKKS